MSKKRRKGRKVSKKKGRRKSGRRKTTGSGKEKRMGRAFGAVTLAMHRAESAAKKLAGLERSMGARAGAMTLGMYKKKRRKTAKSAVPKKRRSSKKAGGTVTAAQVIKMAQSGALKTWACKGIKRTGCGGSGSRVANVKGTFRRMRAVKPRSALAPC